MKHDQIAKYMVAYLPDESDKKLFDGATVRYIYDQKLYYLKKYDPKWPWLLGKNGGYCAIDSEVIPQSTYLCSQDFKIGDILYHISAGKYGIVKEITEKGDIFLKKF